MHFVIMGCGRVGSALTASLEKRGHTVAVVDQDQEAFRRLGPHLQAKRVRGIGFDRDTLREAGIERAAAFAAVSSGDNSNILAARVARETFGIENVAARIYDPARAEVYQRLGIPTVATVKWTADQMLRRLVPDGVASEWRDPSGMVALAEIPLGVRWIGSPVAALENAAHVRVALITRLGEGMVPDPSTVLQQGDIVHASLTWTEADSVAKVFATGPEEH